MSLYETVKQGLKSITDDGLNLPSLPSTDELQLAKIDLPPELEQYRGALGRLNELTLLKAPFTESEAAGTAAIGFAAKGPAEIMSGRLSMPTIPAAAAAPAGLGSRLGGAVGRFFGGAGKLLGRLAVPLLFASDSLSEKKLLRGVAKASGGLLCASLGGAIGASIGTVIAPVLGTTLGFYAGYALGAVGAALTYGYGRKLGTAVYDFLDRNKGAIAAHAKRYLIRAAEIGGRVLGEVVSAVRTYGPPVMDAVASTAAAAKNKFVEVLEKRAAAR